MSNINFNKYLNKNLSIIPDKFASKLPAIKGWSDFCHKSPTKQDWLNWSNNFDKYNVSLCLGPASGIVALDLDTDSPDILDKILHLLPNSPLEKKGSKGFTRFFKYTGQSTEILKHNGNVILEILSTNKKTTLPPSTHPNGEKYVWTSKNTLLDIDIDSLPALPPMLIPVLQQKLGGELPVSGSDYGLVVTGRNSALSSYLGEVLSEPHSLDIIINKLIEKDKLEHKVPYFTDANEHRNTHAVTNALGFYISHMESFNNKRFREGKEYVSPHIETVVKTSASVRPKKQTKESQHALTVNPQLVSIIMGQAKKG